MDIEMDTGPMDDPRECPSCALEYDAADEPDFCPYCGYEFPKQKSYVPWAALLFIILMLALYLL